MNNDIKLIAEAYDQQMNDMKAALSAPPEARDSGAVLLDDGYYFEWWKNNQGKIYGTIYDENDDFVTDEIAVMGTLGDADVRAIGLRSLSLHGNHNRLRTRFKKLKSGDT
jgi:hypothetical protein